MKNVFCLCLAFLLSNNLIEAQGTPDLTMQDSPGLSNLNLNIEASTYLVASSASINIEVRIFSSDSEKIHFYARAGYGKVHQNLSAYAILCPEVSQSGSGGLLGITMLTGEGNHHFEANAGVFLGSFKTEIGSGIFDQSCPRPDDLWTSPLPVVALGYRYQKPGKGFIFRVKIGNLGLGIGCGVPF